MSEFARTRYHAFRDRFGAAGVIIAVIALVAALGGTALAAGGLTKSQERQVTKIAKKYAGKPGATGPAGPAGTNGTNGKDGTNGTDGAPGAPGTNGKSVTVSHVNSPGCEGQAGAEVKVEGAASGTKVCNGKDGTTGFTETLPKGKTETGAWSVSTGLENGAEFLGYGAVSFNIPLKSAPTTTVYLTEEESAPTGTNNHSTECPGNVEEPKAAEGDLCFYTALEQGTTPLAESGHTYGATLVFSSPLTGLSAYGSWAVTSSE